MMKAYSAKDLWAYEDMLYTLQSALNTAKVYEVYTKDEVIAMLTELQLEIEECEDCGRAFHLGLQMASKTIQKKINKLEGNKQL